MGLFTDLFSTKPAEEAAQAKQDGYTAANVNAGADLTAGQANADSLYGQASVPVQGLIDSTGRGSAAYGDATGANGADGLARAGANFKNVTGYQGGLDTGIDQVLRNNAKTGNLGGGNTSADEIKFASDYDNTHYGNYVSGLAPYLGANANAVGAGTALKTGQAALDTGIAGQRASNDYTTATGIGNAKADAALAPYSASSNFWSSLMGAAKLGVSAFTGGVGGGASGGGASGGGFVGTSSVGGAPLAGYSGVTPVAA